MILKKKTVFILGAGASSDYGYPTGLELKRQILQIGDSKTLQYDFEDLDEFDDFGSDSSSGTLGDLLNSHEDPISRLTSVFKKSGQPTIDEFLRTHKALINVGKFLITYVLLNSEVEERLIEDKWLQLIWSRLIRGKSSLNDLNPDIAFVTFNYDTSLEYIFSEMAMNAYQDSTEV